MKRARCALCDQERDLCRSHIVPEFIYKPLYSEEGRTVGIRTSGESLQAKVVQTGLHERLLCKECEGLINRYESPSATFWRSFSGKTLDQSRYTAQRFNSPKGNSAAEVSGLTTAASNYSCSQCYGGRVCVPLASSLRWT